MGRTGLARSKLLYPADPRRRLVQREMSMPINSQQTLSDAEDSCSTLSDGVFLGKSRLLLCMAGLRLTWSIYESRREMPWHAHENTTLYLHVQGEHTDMSGSGEFRQPPFSVSLHPHASARDGCPA